MAIFDTYSAVASTTLALAGFWFKPTSDTSLRTNLPVSKWRQEEKENGEVFVGLGRDRPIVVTDGLLGSDGEFEFTTTTDAESVSVLSILRHNGTILLQTPDDDSIYIRFTSSRRRERFNTGSTGRPLRIHTASYVEVDPS